MHLIRVSREFSDGKICSIRSLRIFPTHSRHAIQNENYLVHVESIFFSFHLI